MSYGHSWWSTDCLIGGFVNLVGACELWLINRVSVCSCVCVCTEIYDVRSLTVQLGVYAALAGRVNVTTVRIGQIVGESVLTHMKYAYF